MLVPNFFLLLPLQKKKWSEFICNIIQDSERSKKISLLFLGWRNCLHLTTPSTQGWQINHIHYSVFYVSVAKTVLLFLIVHCSTPKSQMGGEAPSWRAWWEPNLLALPERNEASGLHLYLLPSPATKPPKRGSFPHNSHPRWFIPLAWGHCLPAKPQVVCSIWLITTVHPAFMVLWLKFRVIGGALQLTLITYVPGFQESHCSDGLLLVLCRGWLSTGWSVQDMSMVVSCLSISKKMKSTMLMAEQDSWVLF